ncbi:hypothetical protein ACFQJ8_10305 [Halocatena marina]|uniref:hypothetical protein n=1 Tax=Halocatena marina TaxID=2934937 RepID=UPI003618D009
MIELDKPNGRGINILPSVGSATIEGTKIVAQDNNARSSIDVVHIAEGAGEVLIKGGSLTQNHAGQALQILDGDAPVVVEGLKVTGDASGETGGRNAIYCKRGGCEFRDLDVDLLVADTAGHSVFSQTTFSSMAASTRLRSPAHN